MIISAMRASIAWADEAHAVAAARPPVPGRRPAPRLAGAGGDRPGGGPGSLVRDRDDDDEIEALTAGLQSHCGIDEQVLTGLIRAAFEEAVEFAANLE